MQHFQIVKISRLLVNIVGWGVYLFLIHQLSKTNVQIEEAGPVNPIDKSENRVARKMIKSWIDS